MEIISLNVALPSGQRYAGREVFTGGAKRPVARAVLRIGNFEGDGQADLVHHGGAEKAVCVYPFDHYAHWKTVFERELEPGDFSENLTVSGAVESEICVGDVFRIGAAVAQVSQPRQPCSKLAGKTGVRLLPKLMSQTGYTGFYMRVLSEGLVVANDAFERVESHPDGISIADVNDVIYSRSQDLALVERLAELPEFSAVGRALFAERLGGLGGGEGVMEQRAGRRSPSRQAP